ncbi:hypothetical protein CP556_09760 [Natrinema sp. CBA1119]|uniref:DUF7093 family protein n=1 Tax=Natrinema sp. CBA1119 TaxID=1608465 RepID=UPI000BF48ACC|nr:hypothetical protein [Natrinema sp. CBA1119]PGF16370.1 hypothetical protein CP556_09760 [Natrinema sp. CBA1119]
MVLRCSLLGHDFGETDVEREREERGSEVVVTVQEYEECSRCGQRNVISENTEVTSLSAGTGADSLPDDHDPQPTEPPIERDAAADSAADVDSDAAFIDADDADLASEDAELVDSEPDASAAPNSTAGSEADPADDVAAAADAADDSSDDPADEIELPTDENGDPVTDDGEILEDDDDDSDTDRDREHGEWPDSSDVGPPVGADADPTEWPDDGDDGDGDGGEILTGADDAEGVSDAADDEADSTPPDDDAVVLENDASAGGAGDARSVTAEAPAAEHGDADAASESGTGIERADSVATPAESDAAPATTVPTEFYCPRCDYVAAGDRASLRAGDICPDCRKGYISERERQ